jgi:hypothetical protein
MLGAKQSAGPFSILKLSHDLPKVNLGPRLTELLAEA